MKLFPVLLLLFSLSLSARAKAECTGCLALDFNKQIEMNLITPMLKMSLEEKVRHIQKMGVEVYRVADVNKRPVTLDFLPLANTDQFPTRIMKLFSESVLGIYMTPTNYMYAVKKPTILLLESTDDWTVIHEFSHYLFDRARMMTDSTRESTFVMHSEDAQEDYFDAKALYRNFDGYMNQEHKERMIHSFVNYAKVQMIFSRTSEFEETTIEKFIRVLYITQHPAGFKTEHFDRSTRYIHSTSMKGQENLRFLEEDCLDLEKTLSKEDGDLLNDLRLTCAEVVKLKDEALKVYEDLHLGIPHQH